MRAIVVITCSDEYEAGHADQAVFSMIYVLQFRWSLCPQF